MEAGLATAHRLRTVANTTPQFPAITLSLDTRSPHPMPVTFGKFNVTTQVFYSTPKSFGIVNLRPLLPGHVLVCPRRIVPRFTQLSPEEVTDLFQAVHVVSKAIETYYKADALNIAIQDGPLAGQSIDHVHCHIIPRRLNDLPNVDDIYDMLNKNDLEGAYKQMRVRHHEAHIGVDNDTRTNRTDEDMANEAKLLSEYIQDHYS